MRKRYVRVNGEQLTADLDVPWGGASTDDPDHP